MKKILLILVLPLLMGAGCSGSSDYKPVHINCNDYDCDGPYGCPSECADLKAVGDFDPSSY